jgi:hypothetical protein
LARRRQNLYGRVCLAWRAVVGAAARAVADVAGAAGRAVPPVIGASVEACSGTGTDDAGVGSAGCADAAELKIISCAATARKDVRTIRSVLSLSTPYDNCQQTTACLQNPASRSFAWAPACSVEDF